MNIVISSGHGLKVRGASGYLDEVNEARRVVERVAEFWRAAGVGVKTFHDDTSTSQNQNLSTIVNYHNAQQRDYDVSVHFNAYQTTANAMGTEVLFITQHNLADKTAMAIAIAGGFLNRGPKKRTDLYFLNNTAMPAVLLEVCFVDSWADTDLYRRNFEAICKAIAEVIGEVDIDAAPPEPVEPPVVLPPYEPPGETSLFPPYQTDIKCSVFGGGSDPNNSAYPPYDVITDSEMGVALPFKLQGELPMVLVHNLATGAEVICKIRDLGPWLTDDEYWANNRRPLAETCHENAMKLPRGPNSGKVPNGAGIDITPAAARAIGLSGMGQVSWRFTTEELSA
jgi:hypothetical protein